jgi:hypothetical protein
MSIIQKTIEKAQRTGKIEELQKQGPKAAMQWFSEQVRRLAYSPAQFIRQEQEVYDPVGKGSIGIGRMYTYYYDPKHKATLPFFDRFPCVFVIEIYSDGFLGLNLHYLRPSDRAAFLEQLLEYQTNTKISANRRLKLSYALVSGFSKSRFAKHCVKRYLKNHIRSRLMKIDSEYWPMVAMLPMQEFDGKDFKSMSQVWKVSK